MSWYFFCVSQNINHLCTAMHPREWVAQKLLQVSKQTQTCLLVSNSNSSLFNLWGLSLFKTYSHHYKGYHSKYLIWYEVLIGLWTIGARWLFFPVSCSKVHQYFIRLNVLSCYATCCFCFCLFSPKWKLWCLCCRCYFRSITCLILS